MRSRCSRSSVGGSLLDGSWLSSSVCRRPISSAMARSARRAHFWPISWSFTRAFTGTPQRYSSACSWTRWKSLAASLGGLSRSFLISSRMLLPLPPSFSSDCSGLTALSTMLVISSAITCSTESVTRASQSASKASASASLEPPALRTASSITVLAISGRSPAFGVHSRTSSRNVETSSPRAPTASNFSCRRLSSSGAGAPRQLLFAFQGWVWPGRATTMSGAESSWPMFRKACSTLVATCCAGPSSMAAAVFMWKSISSTRACSSFTSTGLTSPACSSFLACSAISEVKAM
mmetsp:Transcript_67702/g.174437  ORF Transcript_67702/g.174437 Transcript_67702/m.174437 type:complete len:292 (-) Transcript_67702:256-1131(-)